MPPKADSVAVISLGPDGKLRPRCLTAGGRPICKFCHHFIVWGGIAAEKPPHRVEFPHHPSSTSLKKCVDSGKCVLCAILYHSLLDSRRPIEDVDLPDRQIRLGTLPPDNDVPLYRLLVEIVPLSVETAGLHTFDFETLRRVYSNLIDVSTMSRQKGLDFLEHRVESLKRMQKHRPGCSNEVWSILLPDDERRFFRYTNEISADEYFAVILPFYRVEIPLQSMYFKDGITGDLPINQVLDQADEDGLRYDKDTTGSQFALKQIHAWRGICSRHHKQCVAFTRQVASLRFVPKRLLDLTNIKLDPNGNYLEGKPVLISAASFEGSPNISYAALSHCWGKLQPLRTLMSNVSDWEKGIPWKKFPKTFRDASFIAKSLGIDYLWIDSLCIMQDSEDDWKEQSSMMGLIYRCSVICISALSAKNSSEGLFVKRDSRLQRPFKLWEASPWDFPDKGPLYLFPFAKKYGNDPKGPLQERAWVLQEELLSTRRIMFGQDMVYWQCVSCKTSESLPMSIFTATPFRGIDEIEWNRIYQLGIGGALDLSNPGSKDVERFYMCWLLIIQAYSKRKLTKGSDKLAALAGIAAEYQKATGDTYHAGLWRKYVWRELLWHVSSPGAPCFNRPQPKELRESEPMKDFAAPTWSWASINAKIMYFSLYRPDTVSDHEVLLEILDISTSPSSPSDISNQYTGTINLRGKLSVATVLLYSSSESYYELAWETRKDQPADSNLARESNFYDHYYGALDRLAAIRKGVDSKGKANEANDYDFDTLVTSLTAKPDGHLPAYIPSEEELQYEITDRGFDKARLRDGRLPFPATRYHLPDDYSGHPIVRDEDRVQLGHWAPDYKISESEYTVTFLAVSRSRGLVYCLGLELVDSQSQLYKRIGLGFWHELAWEETNRDLRNVELKII
ncbi:HET-domain-containing protein [Mollisia scopiformis]|uniref:HET-domain-containing protein n=1 Tax=Mollisia scopiformis TaxID=149040 RepID=A0A194XC16_MOLSC|nr:HET-domain-containing protein [Mollisia scopiformis]KUJ17701.1 HET-domain-containing protein [Mollisia scopiformis]